MNLSSFFPLLKPQPRTLCSINPHWETQQILPGVCHREATTLADAFIHQQLSEEARRVPWRTARRNFWRCRSVPRQLGKLELEMHLFFESPYVNLGLWSSKFPRRLFCCHSLDVMWALTIQRTYQKHITQAPPQTKSADPSAELTLLIHKAGLRMERLPEARAA